MHLSAMVLLDMPIAYHSARETEGEERDREKEREGERMVRNGGGGQKRKMQWRTKYKISALSYLEREHRTCSNGIERRLCVSAVSRCSEVAGNKIRNKPEK